MPLNLQVSGPGFSILSWDALGYDLWLPVPKLYVMETDLLRSLQDHIRLYSDLTTGRFEVSPKLRQHTKLKDKLQVPNPKPSQSEPQKVGTWV